MPTVTNAAREPTSRSDSASYGRRRGYRRWCHWTDGSALMALWVNARLATSRRGQRVAVEGVVEGGAVGVADLPAEVDLGHAHGRGDVPDGNEVVERRLDVHGAAVLGGVQHQHPLGLSVPAVVDQRVRHPADSGLAA